MALKLAINGFGRIGRKAFRLALDRKDVEIAAINDLSDLKTAAHLLSFDSVHGPLGMPVTVEGSNLIVGGRKIRCSAERDPANLPWKEMEVDIALECTGIFTDKDKAALHLKAGARKVLISAPSKDAEVTLCLGINDKDFDGSKHSVISNASCTTNALAPIAKVMDEKFGIVRGLMTTIHSYTNDQNVLDLAHKDLRRARAAALNMIPTSTGAAKAISLVLPRLKGKLDGFAMRVPTPNVSVVDLTVELSKSATAAEINQAMKEAAAGPLRGILRYSEDPLVSSDYNGDLHSSCFDALSTIVIEGKLAKLISWYDNESGYSARLLDIAVRVGARS
jgi:glyceraldehyde 3-phosphate dehydrogenase